MTHMHRTAPTLEELEKAQLFVGEMIASRPEGDAYLAIFERLDVEIEAMRARQSTRDRALALVKQKREAEGRAAA